MHVARTYGDFKALIPLPSDKAQGRQEQENGHQVIQKDGPVERWFE